MQQRRSRKENRASLGASTKIDNEKTHLRRLDLSAGGDGARTDGAALRGRGAGGERRARTGGEGGVHGFEAETKEKSEDAT